MTALLSVSHCFVVSELLSNDRGEQSETCARLDDMAARRLDRSALRPKPLTLSRPEVSVFGLGANAYAERGADETVISPTLSATHYSGDLNVLEVDRFDKNAWFQHVATLPSQPVRFWIHIHPIHQEASAWFEVECPSHRHAADQC